MDNIDTLKSIANELSSAGLPQLSTEIVKIANNLNNIKTAQFVGVQGYAIRNSRCWGNCYRQKRVTQPKLAAQEIWEECHSEYLKSINNDKSGWEKYADVNIPMTKFASVKNAQEIINGQKNAFNAALEQNIKNGIPVGNAFVLASNEVNDRFSEEIMNDVEKLTKLSSFVKEANQELYDKLITTANEIIKEAQFGGMWDRAKNWMGGAVDKAKGFVGLGDKKNVWLNNIDKQVQGLVSIIGSYRSDPNATNNFNQSYKKFSNTIRSSFAKIQEIFKGDQGAQNFLTALQSVNQETVGGKAAQIVLNLNKAINAYKNVLAQEKQQPQQNQQAQTEQNSWTPERTKSFYNALMEGIKNNPDLKHNLIQLLQSRMTPATQPVAAPTPADMSGSLSASSVFNLKKIAAQSFNLNQLAEFVKQLPQEQVKSMLQQLVPAEARPAEVKPTTTTTVQEDPAVAAQKQADLQKQWVELKKQYGKSQKYWQVLNTVLAKHLDEVVPALKASVPAPAQKAPVTPTAPAGAFEATKSNAIASTENGMKKYFSVI